MNINLSESFQVQAMFISQMLLVTGGNNRGGISSTEVFVKSSIYVKASQVSPLFGYLVCPWVTWLNSFVTYFASRWLSTLQAAHSTGGKLENFLLHVGPWLPPRSVGTSMSPEVYKVVLATSPLFLPGTRERRRGMRLVTWQWLDTTMELWQFH